MVSSGICSAAPAQKLMLHRVGWVGATAGPRKLCAAVRESTRAPSNPPPPPSSPRYRNGSRRRTGAGAEMTRETRSRHRWCRPNWIAPSNFRPRRSFVSCRAGAERGMPHRAEQVGATATPEKPFSAVAHPNRRGGSLGARWHRIGSLERPHGQNPKKIETQNGKTDRWKKPQAATGPSVPRPKTTHGSCLPHANISKKWRNRSARFTRNMPPEMRVPSDMSARLKL